MDRDFRKGYLEIDFPTEPFGSPFRILGRSLALLASQLPFVAAVTLAVFLPGKLLLQFACYVADVPAEGILSYFLMSVSDLVLGALAVPAVVFGMVVRFRTGQPPAVAEALRWGRRQWAKSLWNEFQVQVTVLLWSLLLVVPGVMAYVRLSLVDPIVAIEADRESRVLERSRRLTEGHRWRIFLVLLPLALLDLAASFVVLNAVERAGFSRILLALADSVLALVGQWLTLAVLLMHLGIAREEPASVAGTRPIGAP